MKVPGSVLELHMTGDPMTRREPLRAAGGRMYAHPLTTKGLQAWWALWAQAGRICVPSPIVIEIYVRCPRPVSHLLAGGGLTSAGRKQPYPPRFDLSNVIKLLEDALKGHAFTDDSHVVALHACKQWIGPGDPRAPGTYVQIRTATISV